MFCRWGSSDSPKFTLPMEGRRLITWVPTSPWVTHSSPSLPSQSMEVCLRPAHIRALCKLSPSFRQHCCCLPNSEPLKTVESWQSHKFTQPAPYYMWGQASPRDKFKVKKTGEMSAERNPRQRCRAVQIVLRRLSAKQTLSRRSLASPGGAGRRGSKAGARLLFVQLMQHMTLPLTGSGLRVHCLRHFFFGAGIWLWAEGICANPAIIGKLGILFLIPGESQFPN